MRVTRIRPAVAVCALIALVGLMRVSQPARADGPWYVAPGGEDGHSCDDPAAACATINGAIGKAAPGDTIYVSVGTYTDAKKKHSLRQAGFRMQLM